MRRVVFWSAAAYISGIYATKLFSAGAAVFLLLAVFIFSLALLILRPGKRARAYAFLGAAFLTGFLYYSLSNSFALSEAGRFTAGESTVCGKVLETRAGENGNLRILIKSEKIQNGDRESERPFKIYMTVSGGGEAVCGEKIKFTASLKEPKGADNIGTVDFKAYLAARGVYLTAFLNEGDIISRERAKGPGGITAAAGRLRQGISERIKRAMPKGEGALAAGVLLGNNGELPEDIAESFRKSGLSHIIAVSGMHMSIVLAIALYLIGAAGMRRRGTFSSLLCVLVIWAFTLISGFGISTTRAAIMASIFILSELFGREADGLTSLGWAMLLITLFAPAAAFDLGLMLSAAATLTILTFAKPLSEKLKFLGRAGSGVSTCVSAQFGIMPVLALTFGAVPLSGILANLVIVPLVPLLMIFAALAGALAPFGGFGAFMAYPARALGSFIIFVARVSEEMPLATIITGSPGFLAGAGYIFILAALYHSLIKRRARSLLALNAAAACFLAIMISAALPGARLHFINVGQGDCALITTARGAAVMIDAGGLRYKDVGKEILSPYLKMTKTGKIDAALLTHYHYDHLGGYLHLLSEGLIRKIYIPETLEEIPLKNELEAAAKKGGAKIGYTKAGDSLALPGGGVVSVVAGSAGGGDNEDCLVYRLDYGECSALFTADMTGEMEERLTRLLADLPCGILSVSHHGSKTSTSEIFLGYVKPRCAVISVGQNNYGHPAAEVLERLYERGIETFRTDVYGNIVFKLSKKKIEKVAVQRSGYY